MFFIDTVFPGFILSSILGVEKSMDLVVLEKKISS